MPFGRLERTNEALLLEAARRMERAAVGRKNMVGRKYELCVVYVKPGGGRCWYRRDLQWHRKAK